MNYKLSYPALLTIILVLCSIMTLVYIKNIEQNNPEGQVFDTIPHGNNVTYDYGVTYDIPIGKDDKSFNPFGKMKQTNRHYYQ